jgi:Tol biopolymer transport system component
MNVPHLGALAVGSLIVLGACTAPQRGRGPSSPAATPHSPDQPEIAELVDMRGQEIDVSSLDGRIVFSSATDDVYVIDADGSGLQRVTRSGDLDFDPTWSPDGRRIAYRHQTGDDLTTELFVIGTDGSRPHNLTRSDGVADWGPDWSPDGSWIAWNSDRDEPDGGTLHGFVMRPNGSGIRPITNRVWVEYPTWSPDGSAIAFMAQTPEGTDNYEIFTINVDGTGLKRLTHSPGSDGWPAWSPDGRRIVFSSVRDDCAYSEAEDCLTTGDIGPYHTLYIMGSDGSGERRLNRTFGQFSAWSPDGAYILFAPYLNVIRPDGTGLTRIPVEGLPGEPEMPDWIA